MKNQEAEDINPLGIPPPVHVEEQFDEVAPRPANRILRDYARPDRFNCESSVRKPPVAANNFEIRTSLIQTIQQSCIFTGDTSEDPHSHLIDFLELVETAKYNGVPPEAIKLRLFPFSLKGDAKTWLRSLPQGPIMTWDQMTQKFLNKYFSPAKTTKLRQDISNFLQTDTESVYQVWERLKAMLRKYPHHDIPEHMQLYIFYHGLKPSARNVIDAAAGGSVMGKTTEEALQLLNEISENAIQWPSEHVIIKKAATLNQVDASNTLTQQIVSLAQKFESFQVSTQQSNQFEACDMCGGNHQNHECQATNQTDEQVNVIGYKPYPFGSPMAQKHLGFQWSNPNGAENSQSFQKQQRPQQAHPSLDDLLYKYIKVTDEKMESQNTSLKNLEIQLSQLAALVSEKIQGPLPSNTEKNPREHLKAITLRSGKELDEPYAGKQEKNQTEQQVDKGKNFEKPSEPSKEKEIKNKEEKISEKMVAPPLTIPFPQKIKREKLDVNLQSFWKS
ncbi:PREDICTED: uncharacterized protein LOC109220665 [Nicotiana attenuata]|uniref:uncharacterized protein LOC109220665 n=1 Tax=Nicotiana attenuata TaxID=49451 RepID=UPI000905C446|nr:PREDICTED: uncharacterized protein LOC109220665 [Nicotiana attenuata]